CGFWRFGCGAVKNLLPEYLVAWFRGDEGDKQLRIIVFSHEDHVILGVLAQLVGSFFTAVIDGVSYLLGLKVNDQYTARLRCGRRAGGTRVICRGVTT